MLVFLNLIVHSHTVYAFVKLFKFNKIAIWKIDPLYSEISFKMKHLMISTVNGKFPGYEVNVKTKYDTDFVNKKVTFSAEMAFISQVTIKKMDI